MSNLASIYTQATETPLTEQELAEVRLSQQLQEEDAERSTEARKLWLRMPSTVAFMQKLTKDLELAEEAAKSLGCDPASYWKVTEQLTIAKTLQKVLNYANGK